MKHPSLYAVVAILSVGVVVWAYQHGRLVELRTSSAELTASLAERETAHGELVRQIRELQKAIETNNRSRESDLIATSDAVREIDRLTESQEFDHPPSELPSWEAKSPYVWLRKDQLPNIPIQPFSKEGGLDAMVADVLTLTPEETRALNTRLKSIVQEYQAEEATHVDLTDEHLPGIASDKGTAITIIAQPPVEFGRAVQEKFTEEIQRSLGGQRSSLVLESGEGWLQSTFGNEAIKAGVYSVLLRPDGSYNIAVKRGPSWLNTSANEWDKLQFYIPEHLLRFFTALKPDH